MTYRMALAWAVGQGVSESDARWLMQEVARLSMTQYLIVRDTPIDPPQMARFEQMIRRRAQGEPVQHILGYWGFCDLTLKTDRRALIPRPETELVVEEALRLLPQTQGLHIADVGCGSGCIGLALKQKRYKDRITLMDISQEARELAAENAGLLRLNVEIQAADMTQPLPGGPYDMICSNPPYIPSSDCKELDEEVRKFDPMLALDGGADGLDFYRALAGRAQDSLKPGGYMILELGIGQAKAVTDIFAPVCRRVALRNDLAGIERVISLQKT